MQPYQLHYNQQQLDTVLERFQFPRSFDFGSSTAGYQVEGGLNGAAQPKNNWYSWEQSGKSAVTGECCRFMEFYDDDFKRAEKIGLGGFRMGIEWSRIQPSSEPYPGAPPPFDEKACHEYARIMAAAYKRGMFPAVTLHHFTHPVWLGMDFWLDRAKVMELFPRYVDYAVRTIGRRLQNTHKKPPIPYFITINEPFMVPMATYLGTAFPHDGRHGLNEAMTCYENLLIGHVLAYRTVHRVYAEEGWHPPIVTMNTWCAALYSMDRLAQDMLLAKSNGIAEGQLAGWIEEQRRSFNQLIRPLPHVNGPRTLKRMLDGGLDMLFYKKLGTPPMPHLTQVIYAEREERLLDAVSFDYYDPFLANNLEFSFPVPLRIFINPWQWHVVPQHLGTFLESYNQTAAGLPIHILENGMCYRHDGRRAYQRRDNAVRDDVLKAVFYEMLKAMNSGIDLSAYYYWSLIDNFEWGSFEPRFGLFGVDYHDGARRRNADIVGNNTAGLYHLFIKAFQEQDHQALRQAFAATSYPMMG